MRTHKEALKVDRPLAVARAPLPRHNLIRQVGYLLAVLA